MQLFLPTVTPQIAIATFPILFSIYLGLEKVGIPYSAPGDQGCGATFRLCTVPSVVSRELHDKLTLRTIDAYYYQDECIPFVELKKKIETLILQQNYRPIRLGNCNLGFLHRYLHQHLDTTDSVTSI